MLAHIVVTKRLSQVTILCLLRIRILLLNGRLTTNCQLMKFFQVSGEGTFGSVRSAEENTPLRCATEKSGMMLAHIVVTKRFSQDIILWQWGFLILLRMNGAKLKTFWSRLIRIMCWQRQIRRSGGSVRPVKGSTWWVSPIRWWNASVVMSLVRSVVEDAGSEDSQFKIKVCVWPRSFSLLLVRPIEGDDATTKTGW